MGFKWKIKAPVTATNAIYLEDANGKEGRPFTSRFLQTGLVKYDFGVCVLEKDDADKFINTFVGKPVIIDHKDYIMPEDVKGEIQKVWFNPDDAWYWCSGIITDDEAIELIEEGYNVSCQYPITEYIRNTDGKLHNGNPYDIKILNGVGEHLAIVKNPRYEGAFIAANAYLAKNGNFKEQDHPRDGEGKFTNEEGSTTSFEEKSKEIKPVEISKSGIPQFESKKELSNWVKEQFNQLGSVKIEDTGINLKLSSGNANRETIKRRASKEENKAVFAKFKDIVSKSIKKDERKADERHIKDQEIYYNKFQIDGEDYEVEIFVDKPIEGDKSSYYAGHNASKITITPRDTMDAQNELIHNAKGVNYIMPYLEIDFNPNATINKETDGYKEILKCINELDKGGQMDEKLKEICAGVVNAFLKAKNEADAEKEKTDEEKHKEEEERKKEEEAKNKAKNEDEESKDKETAKNEDTDKRKLIDEIGGILKGKVDEELWRTVIGKVEKIAYSKSEAGTADNKAKNKCKNEDEAKEKEYEDLKEKIYEEVKNQIAKNSMDNMKTLFYEGKSSKPDPLYISPKKGLELGKQIYG